MIYKSFNEKVKVVYGSIEDIDYLLKQDIRDYYRECLEDLRADLIVYGADIPDEDLSYTITAISNIKETL